jgi:hypothetical protein
MTHYELSYFEAGRQRSPSSPPRPTVAPRSRSTCRSRKHSCTNSSRVVRCPTPRCASAWSRDSQMFLELLDLLAERRIGYLQGFRGSRKAAYFDDPNEGPDCLYVVDDAPPVWHADYA